jgi:propanol-preferring alcohol dehydrogenase
MSDIRSFPYSMLWEERELLSVANLTRKDGVDFLRVAPQIGIRVTTKQYPLSQANQAPEVSQRSRLICSDRGLPRPD